MLANILPSVSHAYHVTVHVTTRDYTGYTRDYRLSVCNHCLHPVHEHRPGQYIDIYIYIYIYYKLVVYINNMNTIYELSCDTTYQRLVEVIIFIDFIPPGNYYIAIQTYISSYLL